MWILQALFPDCCVRCKQEGKIFCDSCKAAWWPTPELIRPTETIDQHFFLASYRDPVVQNLLRLWKYHGLSSARDALFLIIKQTLLDYGPALPEVDAVSFVPLHWRKKNIRGFDQAEEIAQAVADVLQVPCLPFIQRQRFTKQQALIAREDRQAGEFEGVFALAKSTSAIPPRVLLIDDVWTTGATICSAAKPLLFAGASTISAFTLAKG